MLRKGKKGMSVEECVRRAREHIAEHGLCLLLFDVKKSREYEDRQGLNDDLKVMMQDLSEQFSEYFPKNNLSVLIREEKGFEILYADSSWAGINSADIIPEIIVYQKKYYPDIKLHWGVAKDGFEERGARIILGAR